MRWDDALNAAQKALLADSALVAVIGTNVLRAGEYDFVAPSIEWFIPARGETELFEPFTLQLDCFARTMADLNTIEERVRLVLHRDTWRTLEGVYLHMELEAGRELATGKGILGRGLDFFVEVVRGQWA